MVSVQAGFRAWQAAGRDPGPIGRYVEERLGPLLQAGKLSEAETVLDEALRRLADSVFRNSEIIVEQPADFLGKSPRNVAA
jgi:hypothetical protein